MINNKNFTSHDTDNSTQYDLHVTRSRVLHRYALFKLLVVVTSVKPIGFIFLNFCQPFIFLPHFPFLVSSSSCTIITFTLPLFFFHYSSQTPYHIWLLKLFFSLPNGQQLCWQMAQREEEKVFTIVYKGLAQGQHVELELKIDFLNQHYLPAPAPSISVRFIHRYQC